MSVNKKIEEALENVNERIQKDVFGTADLATAGKLNDEQSDRFLDLIHEDSVLLKEVRNVRMNAPVRKIEKLGFNSNILYPADDTYDNPPAVGTVEKPTTSKVELTTVESAAYVDLAVDTLEDNLERGNLEDHIVSLVTKRIARDLEHAAIYGDAIATPTTAANQNDGWFLLATSNQVNHASAAFSEDAVFGEMLDALPAKYQTRLDGYKFYVAPALDRAVRRERAARATGGGDGWLTGNQTLAYLGIPIQPVPLLLATASAVGNVLLAHPQNLLFGVQRDISFHNFYNGRRRVWEMTWTMRWDVEFEYEDAVVEAINVPA